MLFIHFLCSEIMFELDFCFFLSFFSLHVHIEILSVALTSQITMGLGVVIRRFLVLGVP